MVSEESPLLHQRVRRETSAGEGYIVSRSVQCLMGEDATREEGDAVYPWGGRGTLVPGHERAPRVTIYCRDAGELRQNGRHRVRDLLGKDIAAIGRVVGRGTTQASISPRESEQGVLQSRTLSRSMLARMVAGECASGKVVQVPPLPTFGLRRHGDETVCARTNVILFFKKVFH